jgi:hypothetical protein
MLLKQPFPDFRTSGILTEFNMEFRVQAVLLFLAAELRVRRSVTRRSEEKSLLLRCQIVML